MVVAGFLFCSDTRCKTPSKNIKENGEGSNFYLLLKTFYIGIGDKGTVLLLPFSL